MNIIDIQAANNLYAISQYKVLRKEPLTKFMYASEQKNKQKKDERNYRKKQFFIDDKNTMDFIEEAIKAIVVVTEDPAILEEFQDEKRSGKIKVSIEDTGFFIDRRI